MKIAVGSDHAGFELKEDIKKHLEQEGHEVVDVGAKTYQPTDDYPIYAAKVGEKVAKGEVERGIVVCDTGIGVDIAANKIPGVRSALVHTEDLARRTREHNDTNVLSLGAMFTDSKEADKIVDIWLETPFSGVDRHARRVHEIEEIEEKEGVTKQ